MTTMKSTKCDLAAARPWVLAISMALAPCALAQAGGAVASQSEMRLWSFGECERKYPDADSEHYKECMRVVGSAEAKDLRAQRVCEDSYANDHAGIDRCVSAYRAAKEGRTPGSVISDPSTSAATTLTPEMALKVKAIASAAVEQSGTATRETDREQRGTVAKDTVPAEVATVREGSSLASLVLVGILGVLLLGVGGVFVLRRQV